MQATLISRREKRKRGQGTSAPNKKRRASYTEAQMLQALESFEQDKENIYKGNATKFLKSYQATLPQGTTLPPSTFANHVKNRRNPSYAKSSLPSLGGPLALGKAGEDLLVSRLQQIQAEVSHLTNAIIVREALDIARTPQPGESKEVVASRVARCGGDDWLTGFKNRNNIKIKSKRRPVELERAVKNQPEETVQWLRLLLYGEAVLQIHRAMAGGMRVEGWCWTDDGLKVTRENGEGSEPKNDLIEKRTTEDGVDYFWHKVLDKPLEPPRVIFGLDEKPLLPDSPLKEMLDNVGVAYGRTSAWSVAIPLLISGKVSKSSSLIDE
jgi:hypothetical protein